MPKDLELDVVTGSDPAGLLETAAGIDELAKKTDKLGDQMKETAVDTTALDASLEATKLKVRELSEEFAESGNQSILKQINATKRYQLQLESVQKALADTGAETGKVDQELSDFARLLGSNLNEGDSSFLTLQRAVDNTKAKIISLRAQFATGGNESIFGDIKKSESDLKELMSIGETAGVKFAKDGEQAGASFVSGISDAMSSVSEYTTPILVGAAVVASPMIGATIAAAVTTGFGLGVIGLGAISLKNNAQVKAAVSGLTSTISTEMSSAASPMAGPLVAGIEDIEEAVKTVGPDLVDMFTAAAPAAKALADGVAGFADEAAPDFASAMKDAAPAVEALAGDLPQLGSSLGKALDLMAGTPGIAQDVTQVMNFLDAAIVTLGGTVRVLGSIWNVTFGSGINEATQTVQRLALGIDYLDGSLRTQANATSVGTAAQVAANLATAEAVSSLRAQATSIDVVIASQQREYSELMAGDDATLQYHQALTTFNQELKTGAKNWDLNTAAGQKQVGNLDAVNAGIIGMYNSQVNLNGATVKNTTAALNATEALYNQAKQAGATKGELSTLKSEVNDLQTALDGLHDKSITITEHLKEIAGNGTTSAAAYRAANEIPAHAGGGSYRRGPMLVGEEGPEIVVPDGSGTVIPNNRLGAFGSGGGDGATLGFAATGDQVIDGLFALMRPYIRTRYGGNVTAALSGVGR